MGTKLKKSTIKFQRTKLKQTIERRRENSKVKKQIQRRKERRAARGKENEKSFNKEKTKTGKGRESSMRTFDQNANTDEYFCNFQIGSEENLDLDNDLESDLNALDQFEAVEDEEEDLDEDIDTKQETVKSMDESDDDEEEEDDEMSEGDENQLEESDEEMDEHEDNSTAVTNEMLSRWADEANKKSPEALKQLLLAFRSIARSEEETEFTYRHIVLTKKAKHPAKTKNWRRLEKVVQLFLNNCVRFLRDLDQDDMVQYILNHLEPCASYFGCFPKTAREYLRVLLDRWSDNALSSETRAVCGKALKAFATSAIDTEKHSYLPHCLKGMYLIFAKHATRLTESNQARLEQMLEDSIEVYTIDPKQGAQHASVYVSQLASHLKTARKSNTPESIKSVYSWQFVNCLDFWAGIIGATCSPTVGSVGLPVLQPFVDIALNTLRLNPVAQFQPLRVHIIRSLIGLIDMSGYFIPLAPFIFDFFTIVPGNKVSDKKDLEPFDWSLHLKTPTEYSHSKLYEDAKFKVFYDTVIEYYACFGLSIAFPELAIPVLSKVNEIYIHGFAE
ncbi:Noc2p family-domain-containing protein [Dichotomocladium elegans]|nr:Noc2p family-domain-containing protein [Dichotomocladium elegans]